MRHDEVKDKYQCVSLMFFCSTLLFLVSPVHSEEPEVFISHNVHLDYQLATQNKRLQDIDDFGGEGMRRHVVDLILVQQAMLRGGFTSRLRLVAGDINFRKTALLISGKELMSVDSYWLTDAKAIQEHVYISDPIIRKGEYYAALYASPDHEEIFSIKSMDDLSRFSAVSTPRWSVDWQTLSAMPLKALHREDEWSSQASLVYHKWVDFMLLPFVREQGVFNVKNKQNNQKFKLVAVPSLAVILDGSRHFVISRRHPLGKSAYQALQIGLQAFRKEGRISRAYREAGFFIDPSQYSVINRPAGDSVNKKGRATANSLPLLNGSERGSLPISY